MVRAQNMEKKNSSALICPVCQKNRRYNEFVSSQIVREPVAAEIRRKHPDWKTEDLICLSCLNRYRADHVCRLLEEEKGELTLLEQEVTRSVREQESISEDVNVRYEQQSTFGERLSDSLARWGGSWIFIVVFALTIVLWIGINAFFLRGQSFDPYPFILLNLVLSCLAAIQAPIIMMSQNRQEAKDRLRSEHDYRVDLKAELEIRLLHTKLDQLLTHQWHRLLEIQQLQIDLIEDLSTRGISRKRISPE
jgi:uncharacterized membrane protein